MILKLLLEARVTPVNISTRQANLVEEKLFILVTTSPSIAL